MFDKTFRLNPGYSITRFDELNERQRRVFVHLINNKDLYGVLHAPREARLTVKAINKELAEFLRQFRQPMSLDHAFARFSGGTREEKERYIKQLVLDCVLEVETDDGFISGVEAVNRVLTSIPADRRSPGETAAAKSHIQTVSERGIRMALESVHAAPRDLTIFLYNLNRIPVSRRWRSRFHDDAAVARHLDLGNDGSWSGMPDHVRPRPIRYDEKGEPHFFDLHWRS